MKKFVYKRVNENNVAPISNPQQNQGNPQQQQAAMSPDDATKVANLNGELYKLASEKDQLYMKMSNIQKSIDEIKTKYKSMQPVNPNNQQQQPQDDVTSNIMECKVRIMDIHTYINEDERPANIIQFDEEPATEQISQDTTEMVDNDIDNNTEIIEKTKKVKTDEPQLNVDDSGKTEYIESDKSEEGISIYVKFKDDGHLVLGKIYKVDDKSDWETKVMKGESDTFEEMAFVKNLGVYGVLDKLEGFYDDVNLVKDETIDNMMGETNEGIKPKFRFLTIE